VNKKKHYNMEITFMAWIICYPPTIKKIKLETTNQFLRCISKILVRYLGFVGIAKIGHC
jgi:hypothetical protein